MTRSRHIVVQFCLLVLLIGTACRPVPEVGPEGLHLLDLLPPEPELEGKGPQPARKKHWSLTNRLPGVWHAGPEGVLVEPVNGGHCFSADAPPWLELRMVIDPLRYEKVLVVFGEGEGEEAELYYSYDDPPVYRLGGRVEAKPVLRPSPDERQFLLPHPDGAEEPLRAFRLYPGGREGGAVTVKEITLVPRRSHFLEEAIFSRDRIDLNQEYRRCWRISGGGERRVDFMVPETGAVLRFSTGTLLGGGDSWLRLVARAPGRPAEDLLSVPVGRTGDGWTDHRVDLVPWAGQKLTLRFQVQSEEGSGAIRLIGAPVVRVVDGRKRPNVVLLVVDTLRADRLSAYGHPERLSPHLDRLARQGLLFSRARAPSSWTIPSTAALLTGRYPSGPGAEKGKVPPVDPASVTLAERFSRQGYATGGFSANFVLDGFRGFARGFDTWYLAPFRDAHLTARELNRRALDWIQSQQGEPFFLYLQYMDPHEPYDAPTPAHPLGKSGGAFDIHRGHRWRDGNIVPLIMGWEQLAGPDEQRRLEGYYHEEVTYVDRALGSLLAVLRTGGLLEEAVVLVTADHGEELGDHGHWSHGYTLHREVLHVPMILTAPDLADRAGTVVGTPVSLMDAAPSLAGLAGLEPAPGPLDGRHLLEASAGRTFYAVTSACGLPTRYAAFDGRYAYIRFDRAAAGACPTGSQAARYLAQANPPAEALYDLHNDPLEHENLALRHPELVSSLMAGLEAQFPHAAESIDDPPPGGTDLDRLKAIGYVQ